MNLPAWAAPTEGKTIRLPDITENQLRLADDMLTVWGNEHRRKDQETADQMRGDGLGRLMDLGMEASMARGRAPDMHPLAVECDALIATMSEDKKTVLRLAYRATCSPNDAALRLFDRECRELWGAGYWRRRLSGEFWPLIMGKYRAAVNAARECLAAKMPKNANDIEENAGHEE